MDRRGFLGFLSSAAVAVGLKDKAVAKDGTYDFTKTIEETQKEMKNFKPDNFNHCASGTIMCSG